MALNDRHEVFPNAAAPIIQDDDSGRISVVWYKFFQALWRRTGSADPNSLGAGFLSAWAGKSVPNGYLLCDGREVSRNTYAALFNAIGETWGEGDGKTTFNIPDLMGKFPRGGEDVGETGGSENQTLTLEQIPPHTHVVLDPGHTHVLTDPGHVHTALVAASTNTAGAAAGDATAGNTGSSVTGITIDAAQTGISLEDAGGGEPVELLPPYGTVMWIIKT